MPTTAQNSESYPSVDVRAARRSLASARLALSEQALQNEDAACLAAYRAGELCCRAGFESSKLLEELPELGRPEHHHLWCHVVDGWHDCRDGVVH